MEAEDGRESVYHRTENTRAGGREEMEELIKNKVQEGFPW